MPIFLQFLFTYLGCCCCYPALRCAAGVALHVCRCRLAPLCPCAIIRQPPPRLLPLCVLFQFSACRHSSHWCINNGDVWVCGGVAGSVAFCWTSFNCQSVCQALAIISFYFFPVFFFFCGSMLAPKTPWISFPLTAFFRWIFQFLYAPDSFFCLCLPLCAEPFRIVALFAIQNNFYRSSCAVQTIQQDSINLESLHLNACHWQGKEFTKHM